MLETTLSLASILALLGTLIVLAVIPSVSVLTVSARAAAFGFTHGMFAAFCLVIADIISLLLDVYGLSPVHYTMDEHFALVNSIVGC